MELSICTIMKNEMDNLPAFIEKLKDYGFGDNGENGELILVDTGSSDGSLDYAKEHLKTVYTYEWCSDFSAARNYAASKAKYDIILVLDVDELIAEMNMSEFANQLVSLDKTIGRLHINNYSTNEGIRTNHYVWLPRIYNRKVCQFAGSVHEQIVFISGGTKDFTDFPLIVDHTGYDLSLEKLKKKAIRNNEILFKELERKPKDPYIHYQIGQSFLLVRDYESALPWFEKAVGFDLDPNEQYVQMIITGYGECLMNLDRTEEALCLKSVYEDMKNCPEYLFMMGQIYLNNNQPINAYKEFYSCLSLSNERIAGMTTFFPLHNIGVINEMLGEKDAAIQFYEKAASYGYVRSKQRLEELRQK